MVPELRFGAGVCAEVGQVGFTLGSGPPTNPNTLQNPQASDVRIGSADDSLETSAPSMAPPSPPAASEADDDAASSRTPRTPATLGKASRGPPSSTGGSAKAGLRKIGSSANLGSPPTIKEEAEPERDLQAGEAGVDGDARRDISQSSWHSSLALLPMSLQAPFPKGKIFAPVSRIRETVNNYASRISEVRRLGSFRFLIVQGVRGRLVCHAPKIEGKFHINAQVGYKQVIDRATALMDLHDALRAWTQTQDDARLSEALPPLSVSRRFLEASQLPLAPDLEWVSTAAKFHATLKETRCILKAIQAVKREDLRKLLNDTRMALSALPSAAEGEEADLDEDEDVVEESVVPGRPHAKSKATAKAGSAKKRQRMLCSQIDSTIDLSASTHMSHLASSGLAALMYDLPVDIDEQPEKLNGILSQFTLLQDFWNELVLQTAEASESQELNEFGSTLMSVCTILRCATAVERERPLACDVRACHRDVHEAAKSVGPSAALAQIMMVYPGAMRAMQLAQEHSTAGMEDAIVTTGFNTSLDNFEAEMCDAMEDLESWVMVRSGDGVQGLKTMEEALMQVKLMMQHLTGALDRWSTSAVQDKAETIDSLLGNIEQLIQCGVFTLLITFKCAFFHNTHAPPVDVAAPCQEDEEEPNTTHEDRQELLPTEAGDGGEAHAEPVGPTAANSPPNEAPSSEFMEMADDFNLGVKSFVVFMGELANSLDHVSGRLIERVGSSFVTFADDKANDPKGIVSNIKYNGRCLTEMCEYMAAAAFLRSTGAYSPDKNAVQDMTSEYITRLGRFSELHRRDPGSLHSALACGSVVPAESVIECIRMGFNSFQSDFGIAACSEHVASFVNICLQQCTEPIGLAIVDESIIRKGALGSLRLRHPLLGHVHALRLRVRYPGDHRLLAPQHGPHQAPSIHRDLQLPGNGHPLRNEAERAGRAYASRLIHDLVANHMSGPRPRLGGSDPPPRLVAALLEAVQD